ncbi:DUF1622 domain-containing protein [Mycobacterium ostraviense]|uniref:DUF1622 domain-containing protein n=1 Tax=Mycobacterium ostraviense TaxID=2738409 RepID=UPI000A77AD8F|nr:DUF1622 domain-containing protein [Mycobacterium ostraviense]UGT93272.1 DUF1622 domain-containing protein [Mycobacterium ostraviense]
MSFIETVVRVGMAIDGLGVAVIIIGAVALSCCSCTERRATPPRHTESFAYSSGAPSCGLELLVAGDIIKTIALKPNAQSVAALAGIVAIRTFLSFSLTVEMTGRWPWQLNNTTAASPGELVKAT